MPADSPELLCVADSAAGTVLVDIARIQPYEHNPRHSPNPEYDRIRDSIRSQGLDQPLVITQRPGAADYIVHAGGNTRLSILKELYEQTGDARFARAPCLLRPWRRESDVLLAHLRENDLRGSLTFIDKARAVFEVRRLLAEELGLEKVSQRRLEAELRDAGYRITQARISQMEYAVDRLLPLIPVALDAGLGRPQVERIRALEQAAATLWQQRCPDDAGQFDSIFIALCQRYDGPDWDTDLLLSAIETEIAEAAEMSIHTIRVILDAELAGREIVIPEPEPIPPDPVVKMHASAGNAAVTGELDPDDLGDAALPPEQTPVRQQESAEAVQRSPDAADPSGAFPASIAEELIDTGRSGAADLKSLRARAWTLAARLAQRNGIGNLVEPLSGKGLGFVLRDVPDPSLAEQLDEESLGLITMLWWQLAACAEMTFAPLEAILPLLSGESILRRALETEDADFLFSHIWTLDPGHTGYRLWRLLGDSDWRDLLNLMDTYRRIRSTAADNGTPVWE